MSTVIGVSIICVSGVEAQQLHLLPTLRGVSVSVEAGQCRPHCRMLYAGQVVCRYPDNRLRRMSSGQLFSRFGRRRSHRHRFGKGHTDCCVDLSDDKTI